MGAKIAQDYYPETMGAAYVVNAPKLFSLLWAIVKGFLDERTRSKVRIIGSNYRPVLLEAIDAENLPEFLGGTCTCSHVEGGCLYSKAGPWNDYVVINRQIKSKAELAQQQSEEEKKDGEYMGGATVLGPKNKEGNANDDSFDFSEMVDNLEGLPSVPKSNDLHFL